jgi:hypothetical protein
MLDNLVNPNLGGIGGSITYNSGDAVTAAGISGLVAIMILLVLILGLSLIFSSSRTYRYRKQLVDLYVVGIIRQLAKKEGIDLEEEYKLFIRDKKEKELYDKDLDRVIEIEKAEEIIDEKEKSLKK